MIMVSLRLRPLRIRYDFVTFCDLLVFTMATPRQGDFLNPPPKSVEHYADPCQKGSPARRKPINYVKGLFRSLKDSHIWLFSTICREVCTIVDFVQKCEWIWNFVSFCVWHINMCDSWWFGDDPSCWPWHICNWNSQLYLGNPQSQGNFRIICSTHHQIWWAQSEVCQHHQTMVTGKLKRNRRWP